MTLALAVAVLGVVALAPTAQAGLDPYQSDLRLRRAGGPLRGNDYYEMTVPNKNSLSFRMYKGDVRRVYISIQNDGDVPDPLPHSRG